MLPGQFPVWSGEVRREGAGIRGGGRAGAGLESFFVCQGVVLLLGVNTVMLVFVPILHYYHGFMADAAGRDTHSRVSGVVASLATCVAVSLGYVSREGDPKRATKELGEDLP